jgi:predicted type IV restriction endonuclease
MHLGPLAHLLMATDIYHGIDIWNPKGVSPKRHNRRGFAA